MYPRLATIAHSIRLAELEVATCDKVSKKQEAEERLAKLKKAYRAAQDWHKAVRV